MSLQSKGLSRVFSNTTVQKHQFFGAQASLWSNSHIVHDYWKNHNFDYMDFCLQSDVLLFNMLSRFVITFLLRSKSLNFVTAVAIHNGSLGSWIYEPSW